MVKDFLRTDGYFEIFDILGSPIYSLQSTESDAEILISILRNLPNGTYTLRKRAGNMQIVIIE